MEFRDALKALRKELGITQVDLAQALHVNISTVSRWELGKSYPNPSVVSLLLGYAYTHSASKDSISLIKKSVSEASKQRIKESKNGSLLSVEHSSLAMLIEEAPYPIYVCDVETDQMLYANKKALDMIGFSIGELADCRCYECIMHSDSPCEFCHKDSLHRDRFLCFEAKRSFDNNLYQVHGRLLRWNGHDAQIRYVLNSSFSMNKNQKKAEKIAGGI